MNAKPFLKWAGGKSKSVPEILKLMPEKIGNYEERFVGGGAVFFALANEGRFKTAAINDSNSELMMTYRVVKERPDQLIKALTKHAKLHAQYGKDYFSRIRSIDTWTKLDVEIAARMIYLNKTCFNGLYRVNKKGQFNVPFGDYENPKICDEGNLLACSEVLKNVVVSNSNFEISRPGNFLKRATYYLDPPFLPTDETANFVSYTRDGFGYEDHERLAGWASTLRDQGACVILSNANVPAARKLYRDWKKKVLKVSRAINSDGGGRGKVGELLIYG